VYVHVELWKEAYVTSIAATQGTSAVASTEKVDFLKLQNGRYNKVYTFYDALLGIACS
jgi:hypothetical protein